MRRKLLTEAQNTRKSPEIMLTLIGFWRHRVQYKTLDTLAIVARKTRFGHGTAARRSYANIHVDGCGRFKFDALPAVNLALVATGGADFRGLTDGASMFYLPHVTVAVWSPWAATNGASATARWPMLESCVHVSRVRSTRLSITNR